MDDRLDEILYRLRDLDDRLSRLEGRPRYERGPSPRDRMEYGRGRERDRGRDDRDHDRGPDFDEKRVIDTIVRLVCENLTPLVGDALARELDRREKRDEERDEEK